MKLNLDTLPKVGERMEVKFKSATFTVEVLDARIRYGNIDALVRPITGSGQFWTVYHKVAKAEIKASIENPIDDLVEELVDADLENASLVE